MASTGTATADRISRVIFEHAARIIREQDIEVLVRLNADLARDLAGADRCSLWLIDEAAQELWTKVAHGVDTLRIPIGSGIVGACVAGEKPIVVNNAASDSRFFSGVDVCTGYHTDSVLVIPLRADGKVIGALQALNKPGGFSDEDIQLLGLSASYSASAIQAERLRREAETARLLYHELEIARDVQQRLLPQDSPPVSGLEYGGVCRSARFVGGDYYDFLDLPSGAFAFTIGDVSGKGISAAVLMANIQALLRSQLLRAPVPVAGLMNELNQAVFRSSPPDKYTTLFCGVLDAGRRKLTYVNAGQVSPMVMRADESAPTLRPSTGGFPVGLIGPARYEEAVIDLGPGDLIVCFSDGISEASNRGQEFWDEAGIEGVLRRERHSSIGTIIQSIIQAADEFAAGAEQSDDMTLVAIRVV